MNLAQHLLEHPYAWLALAVLVEGPAATVVAGTLIAAGTIDWWPALVLAVAGDCLADTLWFFLGRAGAPVPGSLRARLFGRVGITPERFETLQRRCHRRLPLLVGSAKLADVAAVPTFAALGASGVAYRRFIGWIGALTSLKSAVLLTLGWSIARGLLPAGASPASAALLGTGLSVSAVLVFGVVAWVRGRRTPSARVRRVRVNPAPRRG